MGDVEDESEVAFEPALSFCYFKGEERKEEKRMNGVGSEGGSERKINVK